MEIIITQNFKIPVYVNDEDYELLNEFKWFVGKNGYIVRNYKKDDGHWSRISMHRQIMGFPDKGFDIDHIDRNRTNNQRHNLRIVSRSQNMQNLALKKKATAHSQYKGVSLMKNKGLKKPWLAYIRKDYQTTYIGYFSDEKEAAHCYNQFAEQLFGDYGHLNEIES